MMVEEGGEEGSEEELAVLPRHTKVVVTGNNRTKSVLVGLQGVVKKAMGLGGWHWLVLTNGIEVKLQRNALSVLEAPTGHEEDDDAECENMQWKGSDIAFEEMQNLPRPRRRSHKIVGPSPKPLACSRSCELKSKAPNSPAKSRLKVDLSKLQTSSLWRYWRHFNLFDDYRVHHKDDNQCGLSKSQLLVAVERHFMSQQLDELQVIVGFIRAAKKLKKACN